MSESENNRASLHDCRFAVPDHIVRREFVQETVILNLKTGKYHGLNQVAATMLDALDRTGTIAAATVELAGLYDQPAAVLQADLLELCEAMSERGFIEKVAPVEASP